jgi:ABC-type microcin C transport system permease subunit YejE
MEASRPSACRLAVAPATAIGCRRSTAPSAELQGERARLLVLLDLLVLFVCRLFAEFIANDRPIVASYKGEILFPVLVDYPEEKFGGFLATTDYRTPSLPTRSRRMAG